MDIKLLRDVEAVPKDELVDYILGRAEDIVEETQEDEDWDDPGEWMLTAVELAHAIVRYFRDQETSQ